MKKFTAIILFIILIILSSYTFAANTTNTAYKDIYHMIADPTTHSVIEKFQSSTLENGRLWVDKSVTTNDIKFDNESGQQVDVATTNPNEFLVTLSALSQSYSTDQIVIPSDVVFILDVSSSMDVYQLGGVSRATVMVAALNNAIKIIMEQSPENRVAVVAYGGTLVAPLQTRTYDLMELGHYDISGDYLSISGNQISVNPDIPDSSVGNRTITVQGATPMQRGIYAGAKILLDNADTDYLYTSKSGKQTRVSRNPAMVLLSDGDPTFGWEDYTMVSANDTNYNCGNGSTSDMGIDLLTIATASYYKEQVSEHYYATPDEKAQFYTIGIGVSGVHAPSVLDPKTNASINSQTYSGTTYNLKTLLDSFIVPNSITFPALNQGSATARHLVTITNPSGYIKDYGYADLYYSSDSASELASAFENISFNIISKGHYITEYGSEGPNFSGYLIMSDIIGEGMEYKQNKGMRIEGKFYYGISLAKDLAMGAESEYLADFADVLSRRLAISIGQATSLINSCIKGGTIYYNNDDDFDMTVKWYGDTNTEYVGDYFDENGNINAAPAGSACTIDLKPMMNVVFDEIGNAHTNLMYTYLSVATALENNNFTLKGLEDVTIPLIKNQQIVRWYIPASLIPVRTVYELYNDEEPPAVTGLAVSDKLPIRACYTIGLRNDLDLATLSEDYKTHNRNAANNGYYFYTNEWRYSGNPQENATIAYFTPNSKNPYYYYQVDTPLYELVGTNYVETNDYTTRKTVLY